MLLSDWYTKWKEKRIQEAVEEAKAKGYEEGYADGKSGTPNLTEMIVNSEARPDVNSRERKTDVVKQREK